MSDGEKYEAFAAAIEKLNYAVAAVEHESVNAPLERIGILADAANRATLTLRNAIIRLERTVSGKHHGDRKGRLGQS
jgi:hypothetical protein